MQLVTKFDKEIEQAISERAKNMQPSKDMFSEINKKIESENKGEHYMKINNRKRTRGILVACVLIVLTTATCFAASQIMSYNGGSQKVFDSYPSEKQMEKAAGFLPKFVENFSNGYKFTDAGVGAFDGCDADGNVVETINNANFGYEKAESKVSFSVDEKVSIGAELNGEQVDITEGIKGNYTEYMNKLVPGDYIMTEQDKADESNGTYIFSFGSEKIEIQHVQSLSWVDDGRQYSLGCYDDGITKDEMAVMAKEVIEK